MMERQDAADVYVRVCEADLIRIPQFIEIAKKYNPNFYVRRVLGNDAAIYLEDREQCIWIIDANYIFPHLSVEAVQEFMVKHLEAHPEKPVEQLRREDTDVFNQRTVDGFRVVCKRWVALHKSFKSWDDYAEIASLSAGGVRIYEGDEDE